MIFLITKKQLPFIATFLNLVCGVYSLVMIFSKNLNLAVFLILIGGIFDFFDGWLAYKSNSCTQLGKQLDSLADLVTFGIAPAFLYFQFSYSTSLKV